MRTETRTAFNAYTAKVAELNGIPDASTKFTVAPTVEQKLEDRIQQSAEFLQQVNIVPVNEQSGETLGLGTNSPAAGRTDTTTAEREPRYIHNLTSRSYVCRKTDSDVAIKYETLDMWAKFPDFQPRMRDQTVRQQARDRLMIGWNGTSAARNTDLVANPLLQDVNIGWLEKIRTEAEERRVSGYKIGEVAGADFRNIDAAVFDAGNELLDEWHKDDGDIVCIVGRSLITDKYLAMLNSADADKPTEKAALATILLNRVVGGRKAIMVPFFPARSVLITRPSNLSIYWQAGSRRRQLKDQPERDRIVDFNSVNEDYVVEDYGACALLENIQVPDGQGGWH